MVKKIIGDGTDFGVEYEEDEYVFPYFGEEIRVGPEAGELAYVDFMAEAGKLEEGKDEAKSIQLVHGFLKSMIHEDDWDKFFTLARRKRQKIEDLMTVCHKIIEAVAGFPTGQPTESSNTRPPTARKSKAGSSSRVTSLEARRAKAVDAAMAQLEGRPDLQSAVARAQEVHSAV